MGGLCRSKKAGGDSCDRTFEADAFKIHPEVATAREREQRQAVGMGKIEAKGGVPGPASERRFAVGVELKFEGLWRDTEIPPELQSQETPGHRAVDAMVRLEKTIGAGQFLRVQQGAKRREPLRPHIKRGKPDVDLLGAKLEDVRRRRPGFSSRHEPIQHRAAAGFEENVEGARRSERPLRGVTDSTGNGPALTWVDERRLPQPVRRLTTGSFS